MSKLRNRVTLIGNLGKDPELRKYEGGKRKATFSMATHDDYRDQNGEKVTETQWHSVIAWGNVADIVSQYLKKGREVAVEGRLSYRTYETQKGEKRFVAEIIANEVLMLDKRSS